jgi:SAM-dependent methyltransferase
LDELNRGFFWSFLGRNRGIVYTLFDSLRNIVDANLANWIYAVILKQRKDVIILEAGCGPAYSSYVLCQKPNIKLCVALDNDISAFKKNRKVKNLRYVVGDIYQLPFKANVFDLVWNNSTLEHLECPQTALLEIKTKLKLKGSIFIGVPYLGGPLGLFNRFQDTSIGHWVGPSFTKSDLRDLLRNADFSINRFVRFFLNFFLGVYASNI